MIVIGDLFRSSNEVITPTDTQRDGRTLGSLTATVVVTAWEDFQCPVCKAANASVVDKLIEEYVDTGKVQFQYRYFSFLGNESIWAAEAAESADEQGKFWEYHDALLAAQSGENRGAFSKDRLKRIAENVGLDLTRFNAALDSGKYRDAVEAERKEGSSLGVDSTPTFFINGREVADWRDYARIKAMIDGALGAAQ